MILNKTDINVIRGSKELVIRQEYGTTLEFMSHSDRELSRRYELSVNSNLNDNDKAFAMTGITYNYLVLTAIEFLRVGDNITINWDSSGHIGQYLRDAGLYNDHCILVVHRNHIRHEFILCSSVTPNNSARMIRRRV